MPEATSQKVGTLSMKGKDTDLTMHCNALAFNPSVSGYEIMVLSVASSSSTIKAVQAALHTRAKIVFYPSDIQGMQSYWKLYRSSHEYRIYRHRMSYGMWHMLAVAKHDGLLTESSHESLWRALQRDSFTTPMLREWVPYVKEQLITRGLLMPLRMFNCNASILTANDEELDKIVSYGVRFDHLKLEEPHDCQLQQS